MQEHFVPRAIDAHQLGQHPNRSKNICYVLAWPALNELVSHTLQFELQQKKFEEIDFLMLHNWYNVRLWLPPKKQTESMLCFVLHFTSWPQNTPTPPLRPHTHTHTHSYTQKEHCLNCQPGETVCECEISFVVSQKTWKQDRPPHIYIVNHLVLCTCTVYIEYNGERMRTWERARRCDQN